MLFTHVFAVVWVWVGQCKMQMIDFVSVILSFASVATYSFVYFCNLRNRLFFENSNNCAKCAKVAWCQKKN